MVMMSNDGAALRILEALGNSLADVTEVMIHLKAGCPVMVHVKRYLQEEEADAVADMIESGTVTINEVREMPPLARLP